MIWQLAANADDGTVFFIRVYEEDLIVVYEKEQASGDDDLHHRHSRFRS